MKLRIIVPTRGASRWFPAALASAAGISAAEIVIVASKAVPPDGRAARVIVDDGRGLYRALNLGWRADGEWDAFTWLNDDDLLVQSGVEQTRRLMVENATIGIAFSRVLMIDAAGARVTELPTTHRGEDVGPLIAAGVVPFSQPGTWIRREVVERVGGFDESFAAAGDLDFFLRSAAVGTKFAFVNANGAKFRVHAGQISRQRAVVGTETQRVIEVARANQTWRAHALGARWRFWLHNLGAYWDRVRRRGFVSMEELYARG